MKKHFVMGLCLIATLFSLSTCQQIKVQEQPKYIVDVQAHRGGMGLLPANTLEAMKNAVDLGVNTLEMDIVVTKDKKVILSHDKFFTEETTRPDGTHVKKEDPREYIWHMTYDEISKYDVGLRQFPNFPEQKTIPTVKPLLSDVLTFIENYTKEKGIAPMKYNIEIKADPDWNGGIEGKDWPVYNEMVDICVEVLNSFDLGERLIVQSFDERALAYMHEKYPELHLAYLVGGGEVHWLENKEMDFETILGNIGFVPEWFSPASIFVSKSCVDEAHRRGMKVVTWTVDNHKEMIRMIDAGVDAIISNYPNRLLDVVKLHEPQAIELHNPISPMGIYIADPTARVWEDGKLYVYGSRDESTNYYCSSNYHVMSTSNLKNWTLHPYSFRNNETLYAPDAWYKDGQYYLYYDTPNGNEYVAVSNSPTGPFKDGVQIEGPKQIDPNIFIDDDGQAYYFWGQFSAKGAKMNPDLKTLDWSTYVDGIVTEKDHYFHEGSFVFKKGEYYYFTYADISQNHRPTSIGYAMSKSPLGPYEYKGIIINNAGCDPKTWNNHGSIVQFDNQWYVFYHRSTHGSSAMRKACIEPIEFNPDGTINEVEMTSQGAGAPLDAFKTIYAAQTCWMNGNARIRGMQNNPLKEELGAIRNNDIAVWKYLDFDTGANQMSIEVKSDLGGEIIVRADSPNGNILGTFTIPANTDWKVYETTIKTISGVHALWMEWKGPESDSNELFRINWFTFAK
jgi:glycerophosphoryl diester phosphodiesterase